VKAPDGGRGVAYFLKVGWGFFDVSPGPPKKGMEPVSIVHWLNTARGGKKEPFGVEIELGAETHSLGKGKL